MKALKFVCPKCGSNRYELDEIRTAGGGLSKLLDVQNKKFTALVCERCKYTEFYRAKSSMLGNIFDLFVGG
ncbi:MAG: zinc ribbon domain-containing protein [Candidatus Marinimicrobia bacterium]|nr:zinc ribbon domain-containing protein [Candidatus Neomarinimicrobiota bacterium]